MVMLVILELYQELVGQKIKNLDSINKNWQEPFGDMRQELVFISQNLDETKSKKFIR